jgi:HEAT repeat protein
MCGSVVRNTLQNGKNEEYYKRLKKICQSRDEEAKAKTAGKLAKNIEKKAVILFLERLAEDENSCKKLVILTLKKTNTPSRDVLKVLNILLEDSEYHIRMEALSVLANLMKDSDNLKIARKLFRGKHEAKRAAVKIYGQIWMNHPEEVIQNLKSIILQEEDDYIVFMDIIKLFGEIGKKYPVEATKFLEKLLLKADQSDKQFILNTVENFAKDNPKEVLELFFKIRKSDDFSSKFIPELLLLTVEKLPEKTFELLKDMATSKKRSIKYAVFSSLHHFKKVYPEKTLEVLLELWKRADKPDDDTREFIEEERVTQEKVKSQFTEVASYRASKALSLLRVLATFENETKRRDALEVTSKLVSKAPKQVFSLLEIFLQDKDYGIKKYTISLFREDWNKFSKRTITVLEPVFDDELKIIQRDIREIFSKSKKNPNESIKKLRKLEHGNSKGLFDSIYRIASQINLKGEKVPEKLLIDGISIIRQESIKYLIQAEVEHWKEGLRLLKELSDDYETSMRIISLKILPKFISIDLNAVLRTLEKLIKDEVSHVRLEAIERLSELIADYPNESFQIITKVHDNQNKYVKIDIAKYLHHFKKTFPKESFILLKNYAEDPDSDVRKQFTLSIPEYVDLFPEESMDLIAKLCEDKDDLVLRSAFNFLEEFMEENSESVLNLLEKLYFRGSENTTTREIIASLLSNFKKEYSKRAIEIIEHLARDSIMSVKSSAFSSLDKISKYQPEKSLEILSNLSDENDPQTRQRVIRSIGVLNESYSSIDLKKLESFLRDSDLSVRIELALTIGKLGKNDPNHAIRIFRKMISSMKTISMREAIAEAMADFGKYCPYEAMKILSYLGKNAEESILRKTENSLYSLREKISSFSYIKQNCFLDSFLTLKKKELSNLLEMIIKKTTYKEDDSYIKEIVKRYKLYQYLLESSTITRINTSEDLITNHINNLQIMDDGVQKAFLALKDVAGLLGKQNFYSKRDDKIENLKDCLELMEKTERQFEREFSYSDNPDFFIHQSILGAWEDIVSVEFVKLRGRAELKVSLESKKIRKREYTIVRLRIINEGISKAENIGISILSSDTYNIIGSPDRNIRILSPNEISNTEFHIKLKDGVNSARLSFSIKFDDAEKVGKTASFADKIFIVKIEKRYSEIENPYIPGTPLRNPKMFYGRDDLLKNIENTLKMTDRTHILILHGQRRTGKTSILYQLKIRLKNNIIPIYFDFQGMPLESGTESFLYWMSYEIWKELSQRKIVIQKPDQNKYSKNPAFYFRDVFLQEVREKIENRKLVFMMDEFESLDSKIREKKIDKDTLPFMRNLMQHYDKIDFIFSGTHRLEEMSSDYWSILFNIGVHQKISFLRKQEAIELICDPIKEFLEYDSLAVEKILEMTAGHPYFIQLVCHYLVKYQTKEKQSYVTIEDVNDVLGEVVIAGTYHFQYVWEGLARLERIVLLTLTKILSSQSVSTVADIIKYLQQHHFEITEQRTREILKELLKKEIIDQKMSDCYTFKVELIKLWCEKNKKLYEIMEETA